jgi:hypothetical protein
MRHLYSLFSCNVVDGKREFYYTYQLPQRILSIGWGFSDPFQCHDENSLREMIAQGYDNPPETDHNLNSGVKSLTLFKRLQVDDIVFVRGDAEILDVVVIAGNPYYHPEPLHQRPDFHTFVPFRRLHSGISLELPVAELTEDVHHEFIFNDGGRYRVMKEISSNVASDILIKVLDRSI